MAVKTNGAEFKRFYSDPEFWPATSDEDVWHDDEVIVIDGVEIDGNYDPSGVPDGALMVISGGIVVGVSGEPSFESYFKRWRKAQATATFTVECDKAKLDAVKAAIKAAGGKVL